VPVAQRKVAWAIFLSVFAAFAWATWYLFVLWVTPGTAPSAILAYPFLFGGLAYMGWAFATGHGTAFLSLWLDPMAWVRVSLLFGMQISVLAATYLTGPVDASLLALIGDVVLTPLLVALAIRAYRPTMAKPAFAVGVIVSLAGGTMTIVGGQSLSAVEGWGWLAVAAVPLFVATYFLLTARANRTMAPSAVVGQSTLAGALLVVLTSPLLPGGWTGIVSVAPVPLALLALCGITSFFLAPATYFLALSEVGLALPPMLMTAIPVFTLLFSAGILGIALPLIGVLGIPVAVIGGILALWGESAGDPEAHPEADPGKPPP